MVVFNNRQVYKGGGQFEDLPGNENARKRYTPMSWDEKRAESLKHSLGMFDITDRRGMFHEETDPEFDYAKKAEELARQTQKIRMKAAAQRATNRNISVANSPVAMPNMGGGGKGDFAAFINAIAGKESGGNYGAVNSDSGALGKYQIMPANIQGSGRGWDYEALGRDISTQAFLSSPKLQEAIARHKLRNYYNQYGAAGAASAWYSGDPNKINDRNAQGKYPSIYAYVQAILRAMGL